MTNMTPGACVRGEVRHPLFARLYHRMRRNDDRLGITDLRRDLLAGICGEVLEIGAGDGGNFSLYPPTVAHVLAVEPEPHLRALAERAAAAATVPITVVDGTAEALPVEDASVDVVVACLVLCSVADPAAAAREAVRVLRPAGELRVLEHVRATEARLARWQDRLSPVQAALSGGCRPGRDTVATLRAAGFETTTLRRCDFEPMPLAVLSRPHVIGRARRA